jgi:hypothetical protein
MAAAKRTSLQICDPVKTIAVSLIRPPLSEHAGHTHAATMNAIIALPSCAGSIRHPEPCAFVAKRRSGSLQNRRRMPVLMEAISILVQCPQTGHRGSFDCLTASERGGMPDYGILDVQERSSRSCLSCCPTLIYGSRPGYTLGSEN